MISESLVTSPTQGNNHCYCSPQGSSNDRLFVKNCVTPYSSGVWAEMAYFEIASELGFAMIPTWTDIMKICGEETHVMVQPYVEASTGVVDLATTSKSWLNAVSTLDFVLGNIDRHLANYLLSKDGDVYLIDHELCWPSEDLERLYWKDFVKLLLMHEFQSNGDILIDREILEEMKDILKTSEAKYPNLCWEGVWHRYNFLLDYDQSSRLFNAAQYYCP